MPGISRRRGTAVAVGLMLLGAPAVSSAQLAPSPAQGGGQVAAVVSGSIDGVVTDETGVPVADAMVSAVGAATSVAVADRSGRFKLPTLAPGRYLVRAHHSGYIASRGQTIEVRPGASTSSSVSLGSTSESHRVLAAGVALVPADVESIADRRQPTSEVVDSRPKERKREAPEAGDYSETAWRVRHARRSVLKHADIPLELVEDSDRDAANSFVPAGVLGGAVGSPARLATSFFADLPFSGQANLFTTSSFTAPRQLFSADNIARGVAYVRVGAPAGSEAGWTVRGALSQAGLTSWIVAGSYTTRTPGRHRYDIGMSYATQRYDGGNPLALRDFTAGSRNAGTVYGFDTLTINPALSITYGGSYAQYDYLARRALVSPRIKFSISPVDDVRIIATVARRVHAPGAEEFQLPGDGGIWLPSHRTFSSLEPRQVLEPERVSHVAIALERDIAASTIAFSAFRQHVDDQLVTLFDAEMPSGPVAKLGHYLVGNAGDVTAEGYIVSFRTTVAKRVHGSVAYSLVKAQLEPASNLGSLILLAPSAVRPTPGHIHDLATTIQADVPRTSTRVLVLYRVSNAFARVATDPAARVPDRPGRASRFGVQVRQSLPFVDFTGARWEILVAMRNFFHETAPEQSIYDELLVIRPPKRIVGGVTVHF